MPIMEILIILMVIIIVFNPKDLPKLANLIGKFIAYHRKLLFRVEQRVEHEINAQFLQANIEKAKQMEIKQQDD